MTRYPKGGKGKKWTIKELDAIGESWKGDTLNDGEGLSGEVRFAEKASVHFRYAFRWHGKVRWHYCGTYPTVDMAEIRSERDSARDLVKAGIDPRAKKIADKIEAQAAVEEVIRTDELKRAEVLTFYDLYQVWVRDGVSRSDGNRSILQSFAKHALPALGGIELRHLTENDLRGVYRALIGVGKIATAVELSKDIGQMLRWAEKRKPWRSLLIDGNPAELVNIKQLVPGDYTKERTRQLSAEELVKLKAIFDTTAENYAASEKKYGMERPLKPESQIAVWICLGTLCRTGELHRTAWADVNFKKRTWFIPAENTKGEKGKKRDQIVYLSDFTYKQFKALYALTGHGKWAFPGNDPEHHISEKDLSKKIGDRQVKFKQRTRKLKNRVENNSLVLGNKEWTPHDLRRTGATMMQKLKISRDVINLCQNHVIGSKVDRVYLLDDYADDKREAWHKLGRHLEMMLENNC